MATIEREVRRLMGAAIYHYDLIDDGDSIAVGVSGGKDSMLLLWLLRERLARVPISYRVVAVHVDPGFDPGSSDRLRDFFVREGFEHAVIGTNHGLKAHSPENRENPCFLCSRLRRKELFEKAKELGCGKIAFGHNQDDIIETFFLNICYAGQVAATMPRQPFFGGEIIVIRPFAMVPAFKVERMVRRLGLPVERNCCPSLEKNRRFQVRSILQSLYSQNDKVRGNIYHAMSHVNGEYLLPPLKPPGAKAPGAGAAGSGGFDGGAG